MIISNIPHSKKLPFLEPHATLAAGAFDFNVLCPEAVWSVVKELEFYTHTVTATLAVATALVWITTPGQ